MPSQAHAPLTGIRHPRYAGSWYEADSTKLALEIEEYFRQAAKTRKTVSEDSTGDRSKLALIVPHAGYLFSGSTAACAYLSAKDSKIKRVFLLGPSHHVPFNGVVLPDVQFFGTPLGDLEVDTQTIAALGNYPLFRFARQVHDIEHCLELQLPFVRQTFGQVKIVPLLIGQLSCEEEIRLVAEILKGHIGREDLVIVSSDFTHFGPRYGYEPFKGNIREGISHLDMQAFSHMAKLDLEGFVDFAARTQATICGFFPCAVLLSLLPGSAEATLLRYSTSQDTSAEDKDNSVSYMAIEFAGKPWPENPTQASAAQEVIQLSEKDKKALLTLARATLESYVKEGRVPQPNEHGIILEETLKSCFGAFVTLYKKVAGDRQQTRSSRADKELRGCIGSIWPVKPLYRAVAENAVAACSRDYRFKPVKADELAHIEIEISILTPPRRVSSYLEIELGRDGIILSKHDRQSVFLPFVPLEFGWDLAQTLSQLCLKAGLRPDDWLEGASFDVFQAQSVEESS